jgi:hypothetical protein
MQENASAILTVLHFINHLRLPNNTSDLIANFARATGYRETLAPHIVSECDARSDDCSSGSKCGERVRLIPIHWKKWLCTEIGSRKGLPHKTVPDEL